jgi:effector-binding domain-containing protein
MIDTPRIARSEKQPTAVIHVTIPREEIQEAMGSAIGEVMAAVAAQGIGPTGPVYSHHLRMDAKVFDFVVGVPVSRPVEPTGRVERGEMPEATVARTIYRGGYEGLGAAWGEFGAWVADSGHTPRPDLWEVYRVGPEAGDDPARWETELNQPLIT